MTCRKRFRCRSCGPAHSSHARRLPTPTRTPHHPKCATLASSRRQSPPSPHACTRSPPTTPTSAEDPPWSSGRSEPRSSPCHRIQGAGRPPPSLCEHQDRKIVDATVPSPPPELRRRRGIPVNKKSKKRAAEPMTARGDSLGCSRNPGSNLYAGLCAPKPMNDLGADGAPQV